MSAAWWIGMPHVRRLLRRRRVLASLAAMAMMASLSTLSGIRQRDMHERRAADLRQQVAAAQARQTTFLTGQSIEPTLREVRDLPPAAIFVRGLDDRAPSYWDFGPDGVTPSIVDADEQDDGAGPVIDLEFIARVGLGLFACLVAVESLLLIREDGSLAGLAGLPVSPSAIWLGQMGGAVAVSALAWAVVSASAAATAAAVSPEGLRAAVAALARLTLPTAIFVLFATGVGAALAAWLATSRRVVSVALMSWLMISVVLPPTLAAVARLARPVRSAAATLGARAALDTVGQRAIELQLGAAMRHTRPGDAFDDIDPEQLASGDLDRLWMQLHAELAAQTGALTESLAASRASRGRLLRLLETLSPASLYWEAAGDAAGSGRHAAAEWDAAIARRHAELRQLLFDDQPRIMVRSQHQIYSFERRPGRQLDDMPPFRIDRAPLAAVNWHDVSLLSVYAAAFLAASAWRVTRRFR
jgi:hypothetical protein